MRDWNAANFNLDRQTTNFWGIYFYRRKFTNSDSYEYKLICKPSIEGNFYVFYAFSQRIVVMD